MSFRTDIKNFGEKAARNIDHTRRVVVISLFSAVVKSTPVLDGRLRANWITTIGSPKYEQLENRPEADVLNEIVTAADSVKGDQGVFMTNSMPYAYRIEYEGWSHEKRPEGMVRSNVTNFIPLVNEAIAKGTL